MLFKITCINSISMPLQEPLVLGIRWHLRAPSLSRFPEVTGWSLNAWVAFAIELNTTLVWLPNKHSNCVRVLKSVDKYFKEVKLPPHAVSHPAGRLYPTTSTILCHEFYNELNINYVNHAKSQDTSESRSLVLRWIQVILDAIVWAITVVVTTAITAWGTPDSEPRLQDAFASNTPKWISHRLTWDAGDTVKLKEVHAD